MYIQQVSVISSATLTAHGGDPIKEATAPHSIIELIVNFFTFGGVRRDNERFYRQFYDQLSSYCASLDPDNLLNKPFDFSFQTDHHRIEISRTQSGHVAPLVWRSRINVIALKDGSPLSTEISDIAFIRACEVLAVRAQHSNICQYAPVFTESGLKNFENLCMKALTLSGNACSHASFNGSVLDWLTLKNMHIEATSFEDLQVSETLLMENVTAMGLSLRNARVSNLELTHSEWHCCDLDELDINWGAFFSSHLIGCYGKRTRLRAVSADETTLHICSLIEPEFSSPYGLRERFQDSFIQKAYYTGFNGVRFPIENNMLIKTS
ncbi:hypothetical protein F3I35_16020 [Pantoea sp. Bo_7]|uniref:hypothetical protein n=1 Tax=unclassified Pantoea TaxID=2630326 RepID=UPI00123262ED|nr:MULTISPECIES: hypothetical protein [unclassified Pantoea]KAA6043278.1 hypothetical protein F3I35_16020 [Pantoea sp. Bo_7]KAA6088147.1 hypothetical protein F3I22_15865 [Pantoea sp. Bo_10]